MEKYFFLSFYNINIFNKRENNMNKLFKILLFIIIIYFSNSCAMKFKKNSNLQQDIPTKKLPTLSNIEYLIDSKSVVFKWEPLILSGLSGIKIYRQVKNNKNLLKNLTLIAVIKNPLRTKYVDEGLQENTTYSYFF